MHISLNSASDLRIGDQFSVPYGTDGSMVTVEVVGEIEKTSDMFGQPLVKFLATRSDTGAQGYMLYGAGTLPGTLEVTRTADDKD